MREQSCPGQRRVEAVLLAVAAALLPAPAQAGRALFGGSDVVEFVPATFNATVLADPRVWIVLYYADWCGHCQHYAPIFKRIAGRLIKEQSRLRLGALNCASYNSFCSGINVHGYPTVRCYHISEIKDSWAKPGGAVPSQVFHSETELPKWALQRLPNISTPALASTPPAPSTSLEAGRPPIAAGPPPTAAPAAVKSGSAHEDSSSSSLPAASSRGGPAVLRLMDAEIALLYSLRQGVFLAASHEPGQQPQLQGTALAELRAWLDFVAAMLPSHQAIEDVRLLAEVVAEAHDSPSGALPEDVWSRALDEHGLDRAPPQAGKEPGPYWRLCRTYTCGLWTLFHMLTLAAAERHGTGLQRGFLAASGGDLPGPERALMRIRGFVAHFFGCQECATHFLQMYDSCGLERCKLDPLDGEGAALWLWQVHNAVTRRVRVEGGAPPGEAWPARADCTACWPAEGEERWDSKSVYAQLQASYWLPEWTEVDRVSSSPDFALVGGLLGLAALGYFLFRFFSAGVLQREKGN